MAKPTNLFTLVIDEDRAEVLQMMYTAFADRAEVLHSLFLRIWNDWPPVCWS
jgi:hypothetical protein